MECLKQDTLNESQLIAAHRNVFIKKFVDIFETKLNSYETELQNKSEKSGTTSKASEGIGAGLGGALGTLVGAPGAGSAVGKKLASLIGNYLGNETHKMKAGKVNEFTHIYKNDLRKMLVLSALTVFNIYECQFMKVSWTGGWSLGMNRLAQEAVDKLINYIIELNENVVLSVDFITQAIVHGKPKEYIKSKVLKSKVLFNSIECKIANIYAKVGLQVIQDDLTHKYYRKRNNKSNTKKYGYRLLFDWELNNLEDTINSYVEEDCQTYIYNYAYLTQIEKLEYVANLLHEINKIDPLLLFDKIKEEIERTKEESKINFNMVNLKCNEIANNVEKIHLKTSSIREALELSVSEKNKTIWFDVMSPVKSFTGRSTELENLHGALQTGSGPMVISQAATISGLGGVGKSELARKYAEIYSYQYDNVVWINSETQESLKESFEKLAKELQIPILERVDHDYFQERNIIFIVKDIYIRLRNSISLFIFDNAEEYNSIKYFLPIHLSPNQKKPYILITSRNCEWELGQDGDIKILQLNNFSYEESEIFLKTSLEINTKENDEDIKELTEILQCFPLALHQAQAYIIEKNKELEMKSGQKFGIRDYINEYKKENQKTVYLNFSVKHGSDRYVKTVFTTWIITFDNLKQRPNGDTALKIVEMLAYFASDRVPIEKTFLKRFDRDILWSAVELLWKYSIIKMSKGLASIHRLVQEVIRLQLINQKREIEVLKYTLKLINETVYIIKDDMTHLVSIMKHVVKYDYLINEFYFNFYYGKGRSNILHLLAESGESEIIQNILNKLKRKHSRKLKVILNMTDRYGRTPLYVAVENNHLDTVKIFKNAGAEPNIPSNISYDTSSTRKSSGWTPLHVAAYHGYLDIVIYLVDNGAAVSIMDSFQRIPADLAVDGGHAAIVNILIPDSYEHLFHIAVKNGNMDDIKVIYNKGVNLNRRLPNWTSLHMAAFGDRLDIVEFLVENGAIVDDPSDDGFTPIHCAAREGQLNVIKYLIRKVNCEVSHLSTYDGWKILHSAAQHGRLNVVKYLVEEENQDVNMVDKKGCTPLHIAAFNGKLNVIKYLIHKNANIATTDILGTNILIYASINYQVDVMNFLLSKSHTLFKDVTKNDSLCGLLNLSALHIVAAYDALDIVKDLVEKYNFDVNVGENVSFTPLHAAALFDSCSVINYLIEKGANVDAKVNIYNLLTSFNKVVQDDRIRNCSINEIVSPLKKFCNYFYLTRFCPFLLTPSNIHKELNYRPNVALYNQSNVQYSFIASTIISIVSNIKSVRSKINFAKSYMDKKKSNNPYSELDSDYFTTVLTSEKTKTKSLLSSFSLFSLLFLLIVLLLLQTIFL